jgi:flagellar export protein FliJ
MKAFHFPLESLRRLRQQREQQAQQNYSSALARCDAASRALQVAETELLTGHAMLDHELNQGASAARIMNLQTWCKVLDLRRKECVTALVTAQAEANEAFRAMSVAVREREALDKFHEKSRRLWERALLNAEQKIFDELAVQRQREPAWSGAFSV